MIDSWSSYDSASEGEKGGVPEGALSVKIPSQDGEKLRDMDMEQRGFDSQSSCYKSSDGKKQELREKIPPQVTQEPIVLELEIKKMPRVSLLGVSAQMVPDGITATTFPYVLAVHPSGHCVLYITQGSKPPALYLCDVNTRTASRLPPPPFSLRPDGRPPHRFPTIGLIADRSNDEFLICTFDHEGHVGQEDKQLMVYSNKTQAWIMKNVKNPSKCKLEISGPSRVVAHEGELWWSDSGRIIIVCSPYDDDVTIRAVEKPCGVRSVVTNNDFEQRHLLQVSAGTIRYVVLDDQGHITMWSRGIDSCGEGWRMTHFVMLNSVKKSSIRFCQTLRHEKTRSQLATACIHPMDRNIVFLSQERWIHMIDLSAEKVLKSKEIGFDDMAQAHLSSKYLTPWIFVKQSAKSNSTLKDSAAGKNSHGQEH